MTEWASLQDAYGSAERVPALLATAAAAGADHGAPWDELWGRLCHQGTVYSASYAALPTLAQMSAQHDPSGYVAALHLAAAIIASNDGPEDTAVVRRRYAHEVADLRIVAARNLQHATGDTEFVYGLQALMTFEDGGVWQRTLDRLANGEASLECPSCGEDLLLNLDSRKPRVVSFADASLASTAVTPLEPSAPTVEGRLLALAQTNDRAAIATKLTYLFGGSSCPRCQASFEVPEAFA
ncbi:hypothetical protein ACGFIF_42215 [Kribbella sp. NPDC049174]|uniref:hypothetical protein n=1 Tax=Kribbella sp. NPDC049174 TaxID=3364112 RepID=UPI003714B4D2